MYLYHAFPKTKEELSLVLKTSALLDCDLAILGAGTNVLAPDEGIRGVVICLKDGLGGIYPAGLDVGTVLSFHTEADGISRTAVIQPSADIENVRYVYIITDF